MDNTFWNTLLLISSILWAITMGASGFAVAFGPLYATKKMSIWVCIILFSVFVLIGAITVGENVAKTLSSKIIDRTIIEHHNWIISIVLLSAGINLLVSNLLKVPSSTSIIIMMSFLGGGLYFSGVKWNTFGLSLVVWIISMIITYFSTFLITKIVYPPSYNNLWLYEKIINKRQFLFLFILISSIYSAYSIGTNNVANVVGPVITIFDIDQKVAFIVFSLLFGLGAIVLGRGMIKMVGEEIVPIGLWSATIILAITSTVTIISSLIGLPFPTVIVVSSAIIAVSIVKREVSHYYSFRNPVTKKIITVWLFSSVSPVFLTFLLCFIIDKMLAI